MNKHVISTIILIYLVNFTKSTKKLMTKYICEDSSLYVNCTASEKLSILRANYGRLSISMCNPLGITHISTQCYLNRTTSILTAM